MTCTHPTILTDALHLSDRRSVHSRALLCQAVNDLHMILGGYGKLLHESDRARLKATAQKIEDCLK